MSVSAFLPQTGPTRLLFSTFRCSALFPLFLSEYQLGLQNNRKPSNRASTKTTLKDYLPGADPQTGWFEATLARVKGNGNFVECCSIGNYHETSRGTKDATDTLTVKMSLGHQLVCTRTLASNIGQPSMTQFYKF